MSQEGLRWGRPPGTLRLGCDDVHVWRVDLDLPEQAVARLALLLACDERERAERFLFARDRRRYVVAHGALRSILTGYLAGDPASLPLASGSGGKPRLLAQARSDLRFNLSHSGGLGLVAVTRGREVGIDCEEVRDLDDIETLAAVCFSVQEHAAWKRIAAPAQRRAFFAVWTRKEAYLKGLGEGLSRSLASFDVSVRPGEPARLLHAGKPIEATRWLLHELELGPCFTATLAVAGPAPVRCWTWKAEEQHGSGGAGGSGYLRGGAERRGAVLPLARGTVAAEGLAFGRKDRLPVRVPELHQGGLDGHAAREHAGDEGAVADQLAAERTTGDKP